MATRRPAASTRWAPGLLLAGAGILLYRTLALIAGGARSVLKPWVIWLTFLEMAIDVITMGAASRWWQSRNADDRGPALAAGASATVVHAVRVAVFVLGRTGPWIDIDVREDARANHDERWTWPQVVFAGTLATAGVAGVVMIWIVRRCRFRSRSAGSSAPAIRHPTGDGAPW